SLRYFGSAFSYKQYKLGRENAIGSGPVELSGSFYDKIQISDLYFCAVYKEDGEIARKRSIYFKSNVLGHFVVLSRWFSDDEAHRNINKITELEERFERNGHADSLTRGNGNPGKYNFKVYPRGVSRSERYQVKIQDGIKLFLSYTFMEVKLLASPIYSYELASYNPVAYKETKISDKRSNKYASGHIQRGSSVDALMGPSSIEVQTKRIGMLGGVRGGDE
ncbi:hypothetical protein BB560_000745, partial [Smittium megazygosporum]